MKDKIAGILGILGIIFLCTGSIILVANISLVEGILGPGFLLDGKSAIAVVLIFIGVLIFSWLWKDIV